jgi:hypothetical protein
MVESFRGIVSARYDEERYIEMTTAKELYMSLLPHALAAYAQKTSDMTSAKEMAAALANECVSECIRLGIIAGEDGQVVLQRAPSSPLPGTAGLPTFAQAQQQGGGAQPLVPLGTPQQPAQHYNHVGGQQVVPPAGSGYEPPIQAGVMGTVTQSPNPQGYSALGTNGVIAQPEQRPNGRDTVVAPGNQPMIPQVGGNGTMFVPEKIVR